MALRVVFMGTPDFAVPTLTKIVEAGHDVVAVYTRPPQPAGRGMAEQPSPVHEAARELGIPIVMPRTLKIPAAKRSSPTHRADVAVVVAYGLILPKPILDAPRHGCLNLHASALPRWRGAAPIERAIMAGDTRDGRHGDAHGGRARHRPDLPRRAHRRSAQTRPRANCATGWRRSARS